MAPVTPANLLAPAGPIDPKLFPGLGSNEMTVLLQSYIDTASLQSAVVSAPATRVNGMVKAYALYLIFDAVYIRMSSEPLTLAVTEKGSHSYNMEQVRNMRGLSERYMTEYQNLVMLATAPNLTGDGSRPLKNVFGW